jgi:predicted dehydrogenase
MKTMKIGLIGCGNISDIYLRNLGTFPGLQVEACADLIPARAVEKAAQYRIPRTCSTEELLQDSEIEMVVNLTLPRTHAAVAREILLAGKHVYNEKPLALTRQEGQELLELAAVKNLRIGCAPDTVLGAGIQTARALIDEGLIGTPLSAAASMQCHGHEHWHPAPDFYYEPGGGPLFDMGPYYLSALVTLLGPAAAVTAMAAKGFDTRIIGSAPRKGETIQVTTPTHLAGVIQFESGVLCNTTMSFDVWKSTQPHLEIHGTRGSLLIGDPNTFDAAVSLFRAEAQDWTALPLRQGYSSHMRGLGVADMAQAVRSGNNHRCSGTIAFHVLDIMHAFLDSSHKKSEQPLSSRCERPTPAVDLFSSRQMES